MTQEGQREHSQTDEGQTDVSQSGVAAQRRRGIRLTVTAILVVATILVAGFFYAFTRARVMTTDELRQQDRPALVRHPVLHTGPDDERRPAQGATFAQNHPNRA